MLTPDQIKNLKPGDTLVYTTHLKFREYDSENDELLLEDSHGDPDYYRVEEVALLNSQSSIVNRQSKYDPCRRFKKGDKVRVVEWHGRTSARDGMFGFVVKNEENGGMVELAIDGWDNGVFYHACKLELVTPVEELEPYYVRESGGSFSIAREGEKGILSFYFKVFHPHAKEAAEAECDRLNAEYRKEQNEKILP